MLHKYWEYRRDAVDFLDVRGNRSISNGVEDAEEAIRRLKELGAKVWLVVKGEEHVEILFVEFPEKISLEMVEIVGQMHADECDFDDRNVLRLWWD